jgi:hypothetical protein
MPALQFLEDRHRPYLGCRTSIGTTSVSKVRAKGRTAPSARGLLLRRQSRVVLDAVGAGDTDRGARRRHRQVLQYILADEAAVVVSQYSEKLSVRRNWRSPTSDPHGSR